MSQGSVLLQSCPLRCLLQAHGKGKSHSKWNFWPHTHAKHAMASNLHGWLSGTLGMGYGRRTGLGLSLSGTFLRAER